MPSVNYKLYPIKNDNCVNLDMHVRRFCFPPFEDCSPTPLDIILTSCDAIWNCNLTQTDIAYFTPYVVGDKIHIQTLFADNYNADRTNPINGWVDSTPGYLTAELCALDGTVLSSTLNDFLSSYLAGWNGLNSYQIIEIDTQLIDTNFADEDCWSIRLTSYDQTGIEQQVCTQHFAKAICEKTVKIKSEFRGFDCFGHYYGSPVAFLGTEFTFNNEMRYWADLIDSGTNFQKTLFYETAVKNDLEENYLLVLSKMIPPYSKNMLTKMHLAGQKVYFNDGLYRIDDYNVTNENQKGKMFLIPDIQIFKKCEIDFRC